MKLLKEYLFLVAGSLVVALGIDAFLSPNTIATGGASGVGILLYSVFGIPIALTVSLINIALFAFGYGKLNKHSLVKTLVSTLMLAIFIQAFSNMPPLTDDMLLASVFGGVVIGLGTGLVITGGASTGGSDFAAVLLHKVIAHLSIAKLIFIIDFVIVCASGVIFADYTLVLYSFLSLFTTSKAVDAVLKGTDVARLIFVITDEAVIVSSYVINVLGRGVTFLNGTGGYSGASRSVMMCAVSPRQFPDLKSYILSKDKNAFIILTDARGVFGKGFNME